MSDIKYYKTNNPLVIAAFKQLKDDREKLIVKANAFAERFGGDAIMARSSHEFRVFDGLRFNPEKTDPFWTKPNNKINYAQKPISANSMSRLNGKSHLTALNKEWYESYPKETVSINPLYEALGTHWGEVMFSGLGWLDGGDYFYVTTPLSLNEHLQEITVTEYRAAEAAINKEVAA
ncbi:MAG TPA: hypothetical protein VIO56_03115 [Methylotenera sp.]